MMYSEFIKGTGCKANDHNYEVFQNLEAMYMNTDMTKEEIYEYGKKLVDNSKTAEELKWEAERKADIEILKGLVEENKQTIKYYSEAAVAELKYFGETDYWRNACRIIKKYKAINRGYNERIRQLKEILKSA